MALESAACTGIRADRLWFIIVLITLVRRCGEPKEIVWPLPELARNIVGSAITTGGLAALLLNIVPPGGWEMRASNEEE